MIRIDCTQTLGNYYHDAALKHDLDHTHRDGQVVHVTLQSMDQKKSRIYARTDSGEEIGLIKPRQQPLTDGDIFALDDHRFLWVHLTAQTIMTLTLDRSSDANALQLIHLGHTLGNHHYPIIVAADKIYIQANQQAAVIEAMIRSANIAGLTLAYETRSPDQALTFTSHQHSSPHPHP